MRRWTLLWAALVLATTACSTASAEIGPPEIAYGRDLCTECRMIIEDPRFAAAYRTPAGEERSFDDIGGLVIYGVESGELATATAWVHDYDTEAWIPAADATYVVAERFPTPMGHGVLAFLDAGRATAFAASVGGAAVDWTALLTEPLDDHTDSQHP